MRWDITRNLHINFQSTTHAEIEEPYTPINKDLYADRYEAWKDSVWNSVKHFGTPLDYQQNATLSYQPPLNLIPIFNWVNIDANYTSAYTWVRGAKLENGTSLGNTITTNRTVNANATFNFERLYNHIPFLQKANERFNKSTASISNRKNNKALEQMRIEKPEENLPKDEQDKARQLPKNTKSYEKEITIKADTTLTVTHARKSKRIAVSMKDVSGKKINLKWKRIDDNKIKLFNKTDSVIRLKITITAKEPLENKSWYKTAQCLARVLMMVRNASISYRNQYAMSLPGFMPTVGDALGQTRGYGARKRQRINTRNNQPHRRHTNTPYSRTGQRP